MDNQFGNSQKPSLNRSKALKLLGFAGFIFGVGTLFSVVVVRCTREEPTTTASETNDSATNTEKPGDQPAPHIIYFAGHGNTAGSGRGSPLGVKSKGTLIRVRLMNSLETFETVPAFAQIVDYTLGESRFGATLLGDATGDGSVERIKIRFNALKLKGPARASIQVDGQALSLDGTLGIRAEKLEGIMGRAVTASAQSGAAGMAGIGVGKGDLNQFLLKALLSGLQNELSNDLSAEHTRQSALGLKPGVEFFVQLISDLSEGAQ